MIKNDLIVATAIVLGFAASGSPCSVGAPLPTPQALVERAALIVHARAERGGPEAGQIRFRVIGVFKGSLSAGELVLNGQFEDRDDYNDRSVPYTFIRPGGRRGNCYALGYRRGGDY